MFKPLMDPPAPPPRSQSARRYSSVLLRPRHRRRPRLRRRRFGHCRTAACFRRTCGHAPHTANQRVVTSPPPPRTHHEHDQPCVTRLPAPLVLVLVAEGGNREPSCVTRQLTALPTLLHRLTLPTGQLRGELGSLPGGAAFVEPRQAVRAHREKTGHHQLRLRLLLPRPHCSPNVLGADVLR
jgi:hypothetical protein